MQVVYTTVVYESESPDFSRSPDILCSVFVLSNKPMLLFLSKLFLIFLLANFLSDFADCDPRVSPLSGMTNQLFRMEDSSLGWVCEMCQDLMSKIANKIGNNRSSENILRVLTTICQSMPGILQKFCLNTVEKNIRTLLLFFANNTSAKVICEALLLCNNVGISENVLLHERCNVCHWLVSLLMKNSAAITTKREAETALASLCEQCPRGFVKQTCLTTLTSMKSSTSAELFAGNKWLYSTPLNVCHSLDICTKPKNP
jgi:hypothetical protein